MMEKANSMARATMTKMSLMYNSLTGATKESAEETKKETKEGAEKTEEKIKELTKNAEDRTN